MKQDETLSPKQQQQSSENAEHSSLQEQAFTATTSERNPLPSLQTLQDLRREQPHQALELASAGFLSIALLVESALETDQLVPSSNQSSSVFLYESNTLLQSYALEQGSADGSGIVSGLAGKASEFVGLRKIEARFAKELFKTRGSLGSHEKIARRQSSEFAVERVEAKIRKDGGAGVSRRGLEAVLNTNQEGLGHERVLALLAAGKPTSHSRFNETMKERGKKMTASSVGKTANMILRVCSLSEAPEQHKWKVGQFLLCSYAATRARTSLLSTISAAKKRLKRLEPDQQLEEEKLLGSKCIHVDMAARFTAVAQYCSDKKVKLMAEAAPDSDTAQKAVSLMLSKEVSQEFKEFTQDVVCDRLAAYFKEGGVESLIEQDFERLERLFIERTLFFSEMCSLESEKSESEFGLAEKEVLAHILMGTSVDFKLLGVEKVESMLEAIDQVLEHCFELEEGLGESDLLKNVANQCIEFASTLEELVGHRGEVKALRESAKKYSRKWFERDTDKPLPPGLKDFPASGFIVKSLRAIPSFRTEDGQSRLLVRYQERNLGDTFQEMGAQEMHLTVEELDKLIGSSFVTKERGTRNVQGALNLMSDVLGKHFVRETFANSSNSITECKVSDHALERAHDREVGGYQVVPEERLVEVALHDLFVTVDRVHIDGTESRKILPLNTVLGYLRLHFGLEGTVSTKRGA